MNVYKKNDLKLRSIRSVLFLCLHERKSQQERIAVTCQKIMEEDKEVVLAVSHGAACRNLYEGLGT